MRQSHLPRTHHTTPPTCCGSIAFPAATAPSWRLVETTARPTVQVMTAGAVKPLVKLLTSGTDAAKEHAAGALANLANGKDENQTAIGSAGAIGPLLALLESNSDAQSANVVPSTSGGDGASRGGVRARAASALLLLSLRKENGEEIRKAGGVKKLVAALSKDVPEAAGALMNLALQSAETQVDCVPVAASVPRALARGAAFGLCLCLCLCLYIALQTQAGCVPV